VAISISDPLKRSKSLNIRGASHEVGKMSKAGTVISVGIGSFNLRLIVGSVITVGLTDVITQGEKTFKTKLVLGGIGEFNHVKQCSGNGTAVTVT